MIDRTHRLAVTHQARLLGLARASVYYAARPVPAEDLALMRRLDELHLELSFAGSRLRRSTPDAVYFSSRSLTDAPSPRGVPLIPAA